MSVIWQIICQITIIVLYYLWRFCLWSLSLLDRQESILEALKYRKTSKCLVWRNPKISLKSQGIDFWRENLCMCISYWLEHTEGESRAVPLISHSFPYDRRESIWNIKWTNCMRCASLLCVTVIKVISLWRRSDGWFLRTE